MCSSDLTTFPGKDIDLSLPFLQYIICLFLFSFSLLLRFPLFFFLPLPLPLLSYSDSGFKFISCKSSNTDAFRAISSSLARCDSLAAVAVAIADHYSPVGPNDACPSKPVSIAVALADKIDTLVAFWAIDEKPTGSKDPFALRRAALGVIRLITENSLRLSLLDVFPFGSSSPPLGIFQPLLGWCSLQLRLIPLRMNRR